jgi:hypothetical protein
MKPLRKQRSSPQDFAVFCSGWIEIDAQSIDPDQLVCTILKAFKDSMQISRAPDDYIVH